MLKSKFLGQVDTVKAFMGSFIAMCIKYEGRILRWYGESRTAHAKSQYFMRPCGFRPVAFYPNKDFFYNKVESDILLVSYDEKSLTKYRSTKIPMILPEIEQQFLYSKTRYNLGNYKVALPKLELDYKKMVTIKKNLIKQSKSDRFGYTEIILKINDSGSYLKFLYTPFVQNFEKIKYNVNNLEELFVLAQELRTCARELNVRYFEVFISAYNVQHQKIFRDIGLIPRGYVPSWKFNEGKFDDYVLFNYNEGEIDRNLQVLEEGQELLKCLNYCL